GETLFRPAVVSVLWGTGKESWNIAVPAQVSHGFADGITHQKTQTIRVVLLQLQLKGVIRVEANGRTFVVNGQVLRKGSQGLCYRPLEARRRDRDDGRV